MSFFAIKSILSREAADSLNNAAELIVPMEGAIRDNKIDPNVRQCDVRPITFLNNRKMYLNILNIVYPYVEFHQCDFDVLLYRRLEIQHVTYYENGHYLRHIDTLYGDKTSNAQRKISAVLMLSNKEDYEGGNLVVDNKGIKMDKGDLALFNPFTFHSVEKVTKGVRKALVMWAMGPNWR